MKHRNFELALIQKNDPERLRTRTVETKKEKMVKSRSRRKEDFRRDYKNDCY